jgi:hypothetical protein
VTAAAAGESGKSDAGDGRHCGSAYRVHHEGIGIAAAVM